MKIKQNAFTLIEIIVSITVLTIIVTGAGAMLSSIQRSWQMQRDAMDIMRDGRWALEMICNEVKYSTISGIPGWARVNINSGRLNFGIDSDGDYVADTQVWFWQGDGGIRGDIDKIYRGEGNWASANGSRQELAGYVAANPSGNALFTLTGSIVTIEITTQSNDRQLTLRSQVRILN